MYRPIPQYNANVCAIHDIKNLFRPTPKVPHKNAWMSAKIGTISTRQETSSPPPHHHSTPFPAALQSRNSADKTRITVYAYLYKNSIQEL